MSIEKHGQSQPTSDVGGVKKFQETLLKKKQELKSEQEQNPQTPEQKPPPESASAKPEQPHEIPAEAKIAKEQEIASSPAALAEVLKSSDKRSLWAGWRTAGFWVQEMKGRLFGSVMEHAAAFAKDETKPAEEQGLLYRLLTGFAEANKNTVRDAVKEQEAFKKASGIKQKGFLGAKDLLTFAGNAALYSRVFNLFTNAASPLGWTIVGFGAIAKGGEAMKEAAFSYQRDEARVKDIEAAHEEALRIYEEAARAAGPGKEVTRENLEKTFYENKELNDILDRVTQKPNMIASSFMQRTAENYIRRSVGAIQEQLEAIDANPELSAEEKNKRKENVIARESGFLHDLDLMVRQSGTVDLLALGSRYAEKTGKTGVKALAIGTLGYGIWHGAHYLTEWLSENVANTHYGEYIIERSKSSGSLGTAKGMTSLIETGAAEHAAQEIADVTKEIQTDEAIMKAAEIGKGEGVEHALIRQIKLHPDWFGYTGDMNDTDAVKKYAETQAHKIAIEHGYVQTEEDLMKKEIRVREPGSLYILEPDGKGGVKDIRIIGKSEYFYDEQAEETKRLLEAEERVKAGEKSYTPDLSHDKGMGEQLEAAPADLPAQPESPKEEAGGTSEKPGSEKPEEERPEEEPESEKNIRELRTNLNLPESAFAGFEEKIDEMDADEREALRLVLLWQENPIDRWNAESRTHLIETTVNHILSEDPNERKKVLDDFADMMRKSADYSSETGRHYDENTDPAYQRLKNLLFASEQTAPEIPAPTEISHRAPSENLLALQKIGLESPVTSQFAREISKLTKSELSALEIAAHDFGLANVGDETAKNYLKYTLDRFNAESDAQTNFWIEQYQKTMESDLKAGNAFIDGKPLTQEYIDERVKELRALLLHK